MKTPWLSRLILTGLLLLIGASFAIAGEQITGVSITPVLSTITTADGQPISVPAHPQVVVSRVEIAPGAILPMHQHPYPRYGYVLSGTLEVTVLGGQTYRYQTGDFMPEVIKQWHSGKNVGDTPVSLLVIDQVVPGESNTILRK